MGGQQLKGWLRHTTQLGLVVQIILPVDGGSGARMEIFQLPGTVTDMLQ